VRLLRFLVLVASCAGLTGCVSTAPIVPVTPQNAQQIAACTSEGNTHNALLVGDFVLSGSAGTLGAVSAGVSNQNTKTDLAIASAIGAGLTAAATGWTALTISEFTSGNCSSVVGPLPTVGAKPTALHWQLDAPRWNDSATAGAQ